MIPSFRSKIPVGEVEADFGGAGGGEGLTALRVTDDGREGTNRALTRPPLSYLTKFRVGEPFCRQPRVHVLASLGIPLNKATWSWKRWPVLSSRKMAIRLPDVLVAGASGERTWRSRSCGAITRPAVRQAGGGGGEGGEGGNVWPWAQGS